MPKVIKKFEHAAPVARANSQASRFDWSLILSGQNVALDTGTDYEQIGTYNTDAKDGSHKKGDTYDRTDTVIATIKFQADSENKSVTCTKIGEDGKAIADQVGSNGVGIVVTARPLTETELEARQARREKMRVAREAAKSAKESTNGTAPAPEPVSVVETEAMA